MEHSPLEELENALPQIKNESRLSKWFYLFLILVFVLVALGLIIYLGWKNWPQKQASTTTSKPTASSSAKQTETNIGYVNAESGLNLRSQPNSDADIILTLPNHTQVTIINSSGDFYFVEANTKGFVAKEFITFVKPSGYVLKAFTDSSSPLSFLYPDVYKVSFTKTDANNFSYSFTGNSSYGGFSVQTESPLYTLGNYALTHYNAPGQTCDVKFSNGQKECEKVDIASGTVYLLLNNPTLYKIAYLKTEGGLLTDLNNLIFTSLVFK